jgi:predicted Zn-dependent protease
LALEAREAQLARGKNDDAAAIAHFKEAYALDALPNSQQFQVLYNTAIIQIQSEKYDDALNTTNEWFKVTGAQKAEAYALQGNAYYRLEKFQPAVDSIKKALSLSDKPSDSWYQILMASYAELDQYDEAPKVLEAQLAKNPNDAKLTTQLATVYVKGKQDQKAVDLLVSAKQKGVLTAESDYKLMAQLYDQLDKSKEGAAILNEGFSKGIIKPSYEMYKLLGDSYALANDDAHAIEAYGKASPLAKDGNIDYLRGSLLLNNDRGKEAVEALRQAVAKGNLKQPGEAYILLGDAENNNDNTAAATTAWEKARAYPSTKQMAEQRLKNVKGGKGPVIKHTKPKSS